MFIQNYEVLMRNGALVIKISHVWKEKIITNLEIKKKNTAKDWLLKK